MFRRTRRGLLVAAALLSGCLGGGSTADESSPTDAPLPDGGFVTVSLDDWSAVEEHCRRFADGGAVEADDDRISVTTGGASLTVGRDGSVETGMALHSFRKAAVEQLQFDHANGTLRVRGPEDLIYDFRRP
jgi:hypothetical protein